MLVRGNMGKSGIPTLSKKVRAIEKELTKGLIKWRLKKTGKPPPQEELLDRGSEKIVDEAHKVLKKRSKSIFEELKQARKEFLKAYRDDE